MKKQIVNFLWLIVCLLLVQNLSIAVIAQSTDNYSNCVVKNIQSDTATVLFLESFESDSFPSSWQLYHADTDTFDWYVSNEWGHSGTHSMASASYISFVGATQVGALHPDNFLISPIITLPSGSSTAALDYYVAGNHQTYFREHYSVYITTQEPFDTSHMTLLTSEVLSSSQFSLRSLDLTSFNGSSFRLVFRHHNCTNQLNIFLDDVMVYTTSKATVMSNKLSISFDGFMGDVMLDTFTISSVGVNTPIQVKTQSPYSLSVDGSVFSSEVSLLPSHGSQVVLRYTPTQMGFYKKLIEVISSQTDTLFIDVLGKTSDCAARESDFEELFTDSSFSLNCWNVVDGNNDGVSFSKKRSSFISDHYIFVYHFSKTNDADDWLISPLFDFQSGDSLHLSYICPFAPNNKERMQLYFLPEYYDVSVATDSLDSIALLFDDEITVKSYDLNRFANRRGHIAIRCLSERDNADLQIVSFAVKHYQRVGTEQTSRLEWFSYPNPVKEQLYFSEPCSHISLYSMTGQLLIDTAIAPLQTGLSLSGLSSGVYLIRVTTESGVYMQRIVKQ